MGQKVSPIALRLGVHKDWRSRWFDAKDYKKFLEEDMKIRKFLSKKLKAMSVDKIEIERSPETLSIIIHTARPGLIIGRAGTGVEELRGEITKLIKRKTAVKVDIQEFRNPEYSASIMAESIAEQIEKRVPHRRVMKQTIQKIMGNKAVKGVKIHCGGRLGGKEIARAEHMEQGNLPLQTLRADIDYSRATAHTTFGTIGIKVWIYKGEKFDKE